MSDNGLYGEYDDDNVFAQIIDGRIPCLKVYEDDLIVAFMDAFPQAPGHTLVVPKVKARNFLDFPADKVGEYMQGVQKIAKAVEKALEPDGLSIFQFNGAAGGQSVFHLHFHIVPRKNGVPLEGHGEMQPADQNDLKDYATKIYHALNS